LLTVLFHIILYATNNVHVVSTSRQILAMPLNSTYTVTVLQLTLYC